MLSHFLMAKIFFFSQLMGKLFSIWLISCLKGGMSHEYWPPLIFYPPWYQNSSSAVQNVICSFWVCFWSTLGLNLQLSLVPFFPMFELSYFFLFQLCVFRSKREFIVYFYGLWTMYKYSFPLLNKMRGTFNVSYNQVKFTHWPIWLLFCDS